MAKATLRTDFKDDKLASNMGGLRRYQQINNDDGTVSNVDVTEYTQEGDNYGAAEINAQNAAINASFDTSKILTTTAQLNAVAATGYVADATLVKGIKQEVSNIQKAMLTYSYDASTNTLNLFSADYSG